MKHRIISNAARYFTAVAMLHASLFASYADTLLKEDFESYNPGGFPSSAGWQLLYNGAGTSWQSVVADAPVPHRKALRLVGSSCWASSAYLPMKLPNAFKVDFDFRISGDLTGGCTTWKAQFALLNPNVGTWGTGYGSIGFLDDGYISIFGTERLMQYEKDRWYHFTCFYDLVNQTVAVSIDGIFKGKAGPWGGPGEPTGIDLAASHANGPTGWFDNLVLSDDMDDLTATISIESVRIGWRGAPGRKYHVQLLENVVSGEWKNLLAAPINGEDGNYAIDAAAGSRARFYRIVRVEP